MMATRGVLILECLDGTDPGSEGLFLSHMFILMKVDYQYVEVRTKAQFLALLRTWPYELIHITIHGSVGNASGKFLGLWLRGDIVSVEDIQGLKGKLRGRMVITTACLSGQNRFAREFVTTAGCQCYVAPSGSPRFHNAIFFAHIFYHKYFILKRSVAAILTEYDQAHRNPHRFAAISFNQYIKKNTIPK